MGPEGLRANQRRCDITCDKWILEWKTPQFSGKNLLIVEGPSDVSFYQKFVSSSTEIRNAGGCRSLHDVFLEIKRKSSILSLAIMDSDFARVNGNLLNTPGFFYADYHDHEMMCFSFPVVLCSTLSDLSISCSGSDYDAMISNLESLSVIKWFSYSTPEKRLSTKRINPGGLDAVLLRDCEYLLNKAVEDTTNAGRIVSVTIEEIDSFKQSHTPFDPLEVINGHDLISMIVNHANKQGANCSKKRFLQTLHERFTMGNFMTTSLYRDVYAWARDMEIEIWNPEQG